MASTWEDIQNQVTSSKNPVDYFGIANVPNSELIERLGITDNSTLGAFLKFSSGLVLQSGFLRIFGGTASNRVESFEYWNNPSASKELDDIPKNAILVGCDVLGGFFSVNGGEFGSDLGKVYYFAPDTLQWSSLGIGHSQFFWWCLNGETDKFYEDLKWRGYEEMTKKVLGEQGITSYPFPWSVEGKDLNATSKKIVPLKEIWNANVQMKAQIGA